MLLIVVRDFLDVPLMLKADAATLLPLTGLILVPLALVGARRYRLSRMSWRGIRFSFRGPASDFVKLFVLGTFLTSLTFGPITRSSTCAAMRS